MPLYFAEAFKKLGGTVVGESIYALSQPDFSAEVTKIKRLQPAARRHRHLGLRAGLPGLHPPAAAAPA